MFREIREVKEEDLRKESPAYLRIKPKEKLTDKEINDFFMAEFAKAAAEAAQGEV